MGAQGLLFCLPCFQFVWAVREWGVIAGEDGVAHVVLFYQFGALLLSTSVIFPWNCT
jgi:hypothetical protein